MELFPKVFMSRIIPKKRFGQHFLKDLNIIRKIVNESGVSPDDTVIEIGPGLGDMTSVLALRAERVIAIEVDRELHSILLKRFEGTPNVDIINADILRFDLSKLLMGLGKRVKVVANLPYNISTPILFQFFEMKSCIESLTLMFQKEVADRLVAPPGTRDYGVLSIFAQLYTSPTLLFNVHPSAFTPQPKVHSAVVKLDVLQEPSVRADNEELMLRVVKAAFGQRRKTLLNALSSGLRLNKEFAEKALKGSGVDSSRRGETLTLSEFCKLSNELQKAIAG